jgi:hypothetical protein
MNVGKADPKADPIVTGRASGRTTPKITLDSNSEEYIRLVE